jgi:hypothetical protein
MPKIADILSHLEVYVPTADLYHVDTLIRWPSLLSTHIRNAAQIPVYKLTTPYQTKKCGEGEYKGWCWCGPCGRALEGDGGDRRRAKLSFGVVVEPRELLVLIKYIKRIKKIVPHMRLDSRSVVES